MLFLSAVWLPIVVSAVLVFVASAVVHMFMPYHQTEFSPAPNAGAIQAALRDAAPGMYGFPMAPEPKERMKPEWMKKWADGPSGWVTVVPRGPMSMPRAMGLSFVVNLVVALLVGWLAWRAFTHGPPTTSQAFRFTGVATFMAYGLSAAYESIWFGRPWRSWFFVLVDSALFGLVTGGAFAWLWPQPM